MGKSKRNPSVLALELSIRYYDLTIQGSKRFVFEFRKNGYFVGWFTFSSDCSSFIGLEIAWQTSAALIGMIANTPRRSGFLSRFRFSGKTCFQLGLTLVLLFCQAVRVGLGQDAQVVDPKPYGFDIPAGAVRLGRGERVTTVDPAGRSVVAKVYVTIGDYQVLLLPDGQLAALPASQSRFTERPFVSEAKESLSKRLTARGPLVGFRTRLTDDYVFIYNTSEEFETVTRRILGRMLPAMRGYAKNRDIETVAPEVPLVVVMFRTEEEFQNYRRMPRGVVAYYNTLSNQVVMYEESRLNETNPDVAKQQRLSTIAHEGVHQVLHNIGIQQRLSRWPMWISEGLAEYFAPTSVGRYSRWKGAGQVNDLRMFEMEQYLKGQSQTEFDGHWVQETVCAQRLTSTGYASAWALTNYLAKNRRIQFAAYWKDIIQLGPFQGNYPALQRGMVPQHLVLFRKHFGTDFKKLEERMFRYLSKLPYDDPFKDHPHYVAEIMIPLGQPKKRQANVFHTTALAQKWSSVVLNELPANQRGGATVKIRKFANRAQAVNYARRWQSVR